MCFGWKTAGALLVPNVVIVGIPVYTRLVNINTQFHILFPSQNICIIKDEFQANPIKIKYIS